MNVYHVSFLNSTYFCVIEQQHDTKVFTYRLVKSPNPTCHPNKLVIPPTTDPFVTYPIPSLKSLLIQTIMPTRYFVLYKHDTDELIPFKLSKYSVVASAIYPCFKSQCAIIHKINTRFFVRVIDFANNEWIYQGPTKFGRLTKATVLKYGVAFGNHRKTFVHRPIAMLKTVRPPTPALITMNGFSMYSKVGGFVTICNDAKECYLTDGLTFMSVNSRLAPNKRNK